MRRTILVGGLAAGCAFGGWINPELPGFNADETLLRIAGDWTNAVALADEAAARAAFGAGLQGTNGLTLFGKDLYLQMAVDGAAGWLDWQVSEILAESTVATWAYWEGGYSEGSSAPVEWWVAEDRKTVTYTIDWQASTNAPSGAPISVTVYPLNAHIRIRPAVDVAVVSAGGGNAGGGVYAADSTQLGWLSGTVDPPILMQAGAYFDYSFCDSYPTLYPGTWVDLNYQWLYGCERQFPWGRVLSPVDVTNTVLGAIAGDQTRYLKGEVDSIAQGVRSALSGEVVRAVAAEGVMQSNLFLTVSNTVQNSTNIFLMLTDTNALPAERNATFEGWTAAVTFTNWAMTGGWTGNAVRVGTWMSLYDRTPWNSSVQAMWLKNVNTNASYSFISTPTLADGAAFIYFEAGIRAADASGWSANFVLELSTNNGASWTSLQAFTVGPGPNAPVLVTNVAVNIRSPCRLQLRRTSYDATDTINNTGIVLDNIRISYPSPMYPSIPVLSRAIVAAVASPCTVFTGTIVPVNGVATITGGAGRMQMCVLTNATTIAIDSTFPTNCVSQVTLQLWAGTNSVVFSTNGVSYSSMPVVSTNDWTSISYWRVMSGRWRGVGLQ